MRHAHPVGEAARAGGRRSASSRRTRRRSPGSRQSSSVTRRPRRGRAFSAATAESTPPLIATSVPPGVARGRRGVGGDRGAERAVQRVDDELGGVELAGVQAADPVGHRGDGDAGGVPHGRALEQLAGDGAADRQRTAALGDEARGGDPVAPHGDDHAHEVAAGGPAGDAVVSLERELREPDGRAQVLLVAPISHRRMVAGCAPGPAGQARRRRRRVSRGPRRAARRRRRPCPSARARSSAGRTAPGPRR